MSKKRILHNQTLIQILIVLSVVTIFPIAGIAIGLMFNPHGLIPTLYGIQFMKIVMDSTVNFIVWLISLHIFVALIVVTCFAAVFSWLMKKLGKED